jgi:hypothetical protein
LVTFFDVLYQFYEAVLGFALLRAIATVGKVEADMARLQQFSF